MKIIEQYLVAVGSKLPWRGREDIKKELRSLLLDELESRYGAEAGEEQAKELITRFGSPAAVAARYRGQREVIAHELSDLYFTLMGIILGALTLAFSIIAVLEIVQEGIFHSGLWLILAQIPLRVFGAGLGAIGGLTLVFIAITRLNKNPAELADEDWSVAELKDITVADEAEAPWEIIVNLVMIGLMTGLLAFFPRIVTVAENLFVDNGIPLGHQLAVPVFRVYAWLLILVWLAEVPSLVVRLVKDTVPDWSRYLAIAVSLAQIVLLAVMVLDSRLYSTGEGHWLAGFRTIFIIVMLAEAGELISKLAKVIKKRLSETSRAG